VQAALAWTILSAFWTFGPAYVPNSAAVVVGGGAPIDGGRTWRGRRLLGDGKTTRGFVGGTLAGLAAAAGLNALAPLLSPALPTFPPAAALGLSGGAMVGDAGGSLVKRRTGRRRGAPFPLVDQLSFVVGAVVVTLAVAPTWALSTFTPVRLTVVTLATPLVHRGSNRLAFRVGLKDEPW
jgi:CDP-2,3-bis-(O-geranylgeranyl)-sn-glycerol synthase